MGKLLRKSKPTEATYFLSESQRKQTSRLSFIHGSPQLVAVISILVVASVVSGLVIVNKQNASKAATRTETFSWNKSDYTTSIDQWQADGTPGAGQFATLTRQDNNLIMGFRAQDNIKYDDDYQVCWKLTPQNHYGYQNLRFTSAEFSYSTNENGTTGVKIMVNGQPQVIQEREVNSDGSGTFNKRVEVNFAGLPNGGLFPGQTINFCHYKIGKGALSTVRTVTLKAWSFRGDYNITTPDAQFTVSGRIVTQADNPRGVANVQISNCQTFPAATTNENGEFSFTVAPGSGYCVRPSGWDYNAYSIVATNNNDGWGFVNNESDPSGNSRSYEGKVATNGDKNSRANYDFVLKPVKTNTSTQTPAQTPTLSTTPVSEPATGTTRIDDSSKGFGRWGFPEPQNPSTTRQINHSNSGKLTIEYLKGTQAGNSKAGAYPDGLTACWVTAVPPGRTVTDFHANIVSNDSGRNVIVFKASNNPDNQITRDTKNVRWKLNSPVGEGGILSICSKVVNPSGLAFEENKLLTVNDFALYGTGEPVNDSTLPTVKITNPENDKTVSGTITLRAEASDNAGIKYVEFKKGGDILSNQLTSTPYEYQLDTTKLPNGKFELTALAQDNSGNFKTSNGITVNVQNAKTEPTTKQTTPSSAPKPGSNTQPVIDNGPPSCEGQGGIAEAENGVRKNITAIANDPLHPDVKSVVLFTNNSYVECYLVVPKSARYAAAASIRSADYNGIAKARISMAGDEAVAVRDVQSPKDQNYGQVRFNELADYRDLDQGQKVLVRVTFTNDAGKNDANGKRIEAQDRNLWVDNLFLVEVPPPPTTAGGGQSSGNNDNSSGIVPCDQVNRTEAEKSTLAGGAKIQSDNSAPGGKSMVRLATNAQYVECTLKAPANGKYILGATLKSDHRPLQDKAIAKLSMAGYNKATNKEVVQTDTQDVAGAYDRYRMRVNDSTSRTMEANEPVVVRISIQNASNNIATKRNLLVDSIELVQLQDKEPPKKTPADPGNETVFTIPLVKGEADLEEVSYVSSTGSIMIKIEAEKATYKGTVVPEAAEQNASGNSAVKLWSNKNYVEYNMFFPETDFYSLDFAARSENYNGTAEARIVLDGKKLFGDDTKLISSPKHNYYDMEKKEKKVRIERGNHTVRIEFVNDKSKNGEGDRNMLVDFIQVRGSKRLVPINAPQPNPAIPPAPEQNDPNTQVIEAEYGTTCQTRRKPIPCNQLAIPDTRAHGQRALVLNNTADFVETQFTAPVDGTYSAGATLRSVDYKGSAKADIYVDGDKVASKVTPSSDAYRPTFMYTKKFKAKKTYKIKVVFTNDLCGQGPDDCTATNDRNLMVDTLRLTLVAKANNNTPDVPAPKPSKQGQTDYSFVSIPDFLNADIGDVSRSPYYSGDRNSTSPEWESSLSKILDNVQNEPGSDVFIAGDFVEGEWGRDDQNTGIFGPTNSVDEKRNAILAAGDVYYKQGLERFTNRGLTVYPAVGDHEVGDNPWNFSEVATDLKSEYNNEDKQYIDFKTGNIATFKQSVSKQLFKNSDESYRFSNRPSGSSEGTAFAVRPNPEVQLISLDVFLKSGDTVIPKLDQKQLEWVDNVLSQANRDGVDWIIIQGHTPIITPSNGRIPRVNSSALEYQGNEQSDLWKIMVKHKVDLYLAGEVHKVSALRKDGIVQIAHGGLVFTGSAGGGGANYLTGSVQGNEMTLQIKYYNDRGNPCLNGDARLWVTGNSQKNGPGSQVDYSPCAQINYPSSDPITAGVMRIKSDNSKPSINTEMLKILN